MTIPAALVRLSTVLLLAAAFPARAHGFPSDAPLASGESTPRAGEDAGQEAAPEGQETAPRRVHFWRSLLEVTALNTAVWSVDWFVRRKDWAQVNPKIWERNLKVGFKWDADDFSANQLDHPYHGAIYYNIARDNGFNFWESSLVTFLGSLQWELFSENDYPSINDMINTSLGGLAVGEVLLRLSSMILDNSTMGWERIGREVGASLLNPGRGLSRIVRGEAWRVDPTRGEWAPPLFAGYGQAGFLLEGDGVTGTAGRGQVFLGLGLRYGDPFLADIHKPFDSFTVDASIISHQGHLLSQADVQGLLAATSLARRPGWQLLLAAYQSYDYFDIRTYEVGAQSFSGSLLFRHELRGDVDLRAALHVRGLALAAITSNPAETNGRGYDYGPGVGLTLRAACGSWPWEYVSVEVKTSWIHTLNGAPYDHLIHEGRVQADVPIFRGLGLGGNFQLFRRDTLSPDGKAATQQTPEFQVFMSLH